MRFFLRFFSDPEQREMRAISESQPILPFILFFNDIRKNTFITLIEFNYFNRFEKQFQINDILIVTL